MIAATIPMTSPETVAEPVAENVAKSAPRCRKPWTPNNREQLIYEWVKFEGKQQSWVALQLGMHQGTVSRIIERYEKWLAHAQPGAQGTLSHDERLRAQRWLTYERNEIILASALRIAGDVEIFRDVTKTVMTRPDLVTKERELRTEYSVLDRTGMAARFLRLAFRINMEQLKLVEMAPLAPLAPLPEGAFDEDEDAADVGRPCNPSGPCSEGKDEDEEGAGQEGGAEDEDESQADEVQAAAEPDECAALDEPQSEASADVVDGGAAQPQNPSPPSASPVSAHNAHTCTEPELVASAETVEGCVQNPRQRELRLSRINDAAQDPESARETTHEDPARHPEQGGGQARPRGLPATT